MWNSDTGWGRAYSATPARLGGEARHGGILAEAAIRFENETPAKGTATAGEADASLILILCLPLFTESDNSAAPKLVAKGRNSEAEPPRDRCRIHDEIVAVTRDPGQTALVDNIVPPAGSGAVAKWFGDDADLQTCDNHDKW